jgi:Glycosyl hydrolase family 30 TIM-barrel domain
MDETKPLLGEGGDSNGGKKMRPDGTSHSRNGISCRPCEALAVALLFVAAVLLFFPSPHKGSVITVSDASGGPVQQEGVPPVMYRPFCLTHHPRTTARILQTSMGSPSQQWSHVACYSQPDTVRSWMSGSPPVGVNLNAYGAPDAMLQTNFGTPSPFSDRTPILGFGAAFTEAASLNYQTLSETGKTTLMELLFGKSGLGYSLGRVHINSCDFSVESYNFDNVDGDFQLKHFDMNVTHDAKKDGMIDMILRATTVFNQEWSDGIDGQFKMYASPWSPPGWMKNPTWQDEPEATYAHQMAFSTVPSCLRDGTAKKSRYAKAWALYFSKFIEAYRNKGVPLWAVTVQNEPEFPAPWE